MVEQLQGDEEIFKTVNIETRAYCEVNDSISEAAEKKGRLVTGLNQLLQKTDEELMRRYGAQNNVGRRRVGNLLKSVATHFLGWHCVSAGLSKNIICHRYLKMTISRNSSVKIGHNVLRNLLGVV